MVPEWNPAWNAETLNLAYEVAVEREGMYGEWADALDNKAVAIFGVASVIVTLTPALPQPVPMPASILLWVIAVAFWVAAANSCYKAYSPREFRVGPDPQILRTEEWLTLSPTEYRFYMLGYMGQVYDKNTLALSQKAEALAKAIWYTAGEVLFLAAAFVLANIL